MKNYICEGERIETVAPSGGITSGDLFLIGSKVAVSQDTAAGGAAIVGYLSGVFSVPKAVGAITIGQPLYFHSGDGNVSTVAAGGVLAGYAYVAALSADAKVQMLLVDNVQGGQAATVAAISTANATDLDTAQALANQLKTTVNAILTALKAAGLMA